MSELTRYPYFFETAEGDDDDKVVIGGDSDEESAVHGGDADEESTVKGGDSDETVTYEGDSDTSAPVPDVPKRKKHRCCLAFFITALVLVLVLCGGILGGAYFAWDKFLGESTQMNVFEGLGVLSNLYKAKDSVVTAPYGEKDLDDFYERVLDALCMTTNDGYELDIPQIVVDEMNGGEQTDVEEALTEMNGGVSPYAAAEENATAGENQTTGNNELDELLNNLKFDWASLEEVTPKTGEVDLSGPQIAAFLNEVLQSVFTGVDSALQMQGEWHVNFSEVVELSQVVISAGDTINQEDVCVSATIKIKLRDAIKSVAQKFDGIAAFGIKAAAVLLPKEIYFSASVYPCARDGRAGVVVNSTSAEDMDKMLRIVDGVLALTGSESRSGDFLTQINTTVYNALQSVSALIPVNFVSDVINTKPIGAMLSVMGLDLTPQEFFEIVRYVAAPDHYMDDANKDGQIDGFEYVETYTSQGLKETLRRDFGLNVKDENDPELPGVYIDDNNLYTSLNDLLFGTDEIIDNINFALVADNDDITANSTSLVDYPSMAAVMRSYLVSDKASGIIADYGFKLLSLEYNEELSELNGTVFVTAKFSLDIRSSLAHSNPDLFDENGLFHNLITQLIPSNVFLTADIEISEATQGNMRTDIVFNDAEYNTPELLDSMCRLLVGLGAGEELANDLSYDSVCSTLTTAITDVFAATDENGEPAGISKYVRGFDSDGLKLASVYALMYSVSYEEKLPEGAEAAVQPEAFADAVKHIYLFEENIADGNVTVNNKVISESGFLGRNYRPDSENALDLQKLLVDALLPNPTGTNVVADIKDVTLADVIIAREHQLAAGPEEGEGEQARAGEEQPGGGEEGAQDARNNLAASLGLSADVKYGEHYWIEQLIMLGSDGVDGAQEQKVFDSFKEKYNAWRVMNGMEEKTSPEELMVVTVTLASSALEDNNAVFKLLPEYFTITIIMDLSLTKEQRTALKKASITDMFGSEDGTIPANEDLQDVFGVAVFINDMDAEDIGVLAQVLAVDPQTANLAQTIFGTDLNGKVRRFLLSFALHEQNEEAADPIPDIAMYKALACSDVLSTNANANAQALADTAENAGTDTGVQEPEYDTTEREGLGKLAINVTEFAAACSIDLEEILQGAAGQLP